MCEHPVCLKPLSPLHLPLFTDGLEDSPAEGSPSDNNATLHHSIKQLAKSLKLRQPDKNWASELVNDLRDKFLEYLKHNAHSNLQDVTVLNTGSYYETVKVRERCCRVVRGPLWSVLRCSVWLCSVAIIAQVCSESVGGQVYSLQCGVVG